MSNDLADLTRDQIERSKHLTLARWLSACYEGERKMEPAVMVFQRRWPRDLHKHVIVQKAAVGADTLDGALTNTPTLLGEAFVRLAMPFSIIGRLGLRRVPFSTPIHSGTPPSAFGWVGEGKPTPAVTLSHAASDRLLPLKAGWIIVLSAEVLKLSTPGSEDLVIADLRDGLTAGLDGQFTDPLVAAVAGENPGSITEPVAAPIASSGGTPADAIEDLRQLHALYVSGGAKVEAAALLMSSANAVALALADPERFGTLTRSGGTLGGLPVVCSDSVGPRVIMLDTSQVLLADDGAADLSVSRQADIEMLDGALQQNGVTGAGAQVVSLWQSGLAAVRVERTINWRAPAGAVQYVESAYYYPAGSPL